MPTIDEAMKALTAAWNRGCATPDQPSERTLYNYADDLWADPNDQLDLQLAVDRAAAGVLLGHL